MKKASGFLRFASPNEQRTITREHLGLYHAIIIGAVYQFQDNFDVYTPYSFYTALHQCIQDHPFLSITVEDKHTDKSYFRGVQQTILSNHVEIVASKTSSHDENTAIKNVLDEHLHGTWPEGIPPWKIVVLPFQKSCFIGFSFSHAIGDGPFGLAFHRSLQRGFARRMNEVGETISNPVRQCPGPFDTPDRLPISWGYLLSPFIAQFLPSIIAKWLGTKASVSPVDSGTWLGTNVPNIEEASSARSKIILREVQAHIVLKALQQAKNHDAKFTGLFIHCVARALSQAIPEPRFTNFVNQTAINMRRSIGIPNEEGGMYVSGTYIRCNRRQWRGGFSEDDWKEVRAYTLHLAECASRLEDQAIGLLRYVSSMKKWTMAKFGISRDSSFEVSNVGTVTGSADTDGPQQTKFVFAQPGHVLSGPLAFNVVSVKGGPLVYTVTWQAGALGVVEGTEEDWAAKVCSLVENDLQNLHDKCMLNYR